MRSAKIRTVFCDIKQCQFNSIFNGKHECKLDYLTRDRICPYPLLEEEK